MSRALLRLEFDKILGQLAGYLETEAGQRRLQQWTPASSPEEAHKRFEDLKALSRLIEGGTQLELDRVPTLSPFLPKARRGALLQPEELLTLARFIEAAQKLYDQLTRTPLMGLLPDPDPLRPLLHKIQRTISEEGLIQDHATPRLARLRTEKREVRNQVVELLQRLLDRYAQQGLLRDRVITLKGGRMVLPFASHVKPQGVVHGYSHTTETVYVEPFEAVELQNRLVRLTEAEREEERRILSELTQEAVAFAPLLEALEEGIGELDLLHARVRYGQAWGGISPAFSSDTEIRLKGMRHPLLLQVRGIDQTVPLDLHFGKDHRVLLISGPNAGGKSVALKTIGLAFLMGMYGIPIPAEEALLPLPHRLFVVGFEDDQDLLEGASSFTGVITEIKEILDQARPGDVVLLDEFLTSTDPMEASALGYAILRALAGRDCLVFANTHLTPLKLLVSQDPLMVNAQMGFDPVTRQPTYRLQMGEIGASHAFEIALSVGFPPELIDEARQHLEGAESKLHRLLRSLEEKEKTLLETLQSLQEREQKLRLFEEKLRRQAKLKARAIVESAQQEAEALLKELRKELKRQKDPYKRYEKARETRKALQNLKEAVDLYETPAKELTPGRRYRVKPLGFVGELVQIRDGKVLLRVGKHMVEVPRDSLYEVS